MFLIVLLWSVLTCGGLWACEYCRMPKQYLITIPPRTHCKCVDNTFPWLEGDETKRYGDIYYEPLEKLLKQNTYRSYFFPSITSSGIKVQNKEIPTNWLYQTQNRFKSNVPGALKIKRKNSYHPHTNGKTDYVPFHMDVSISPSGNDMSRLTDFQQSKINELDEKNLQDCFDLHFISHSRSQGTRVQEDIISKRNKIFTYVSDDDLKLEINKKCDLLETVITESVLEAQRGQPHFIQSEIANHNDHYDDGTITQYDSHNANDFLNEKYDLNTVLISTMNPSTTKIEMNPTYQTTNTIATLNNNKSVEIVTVNLHDNSDNYDIISASIPKVTEELITNSESTTIEPLALTTLYMQNRTKLATVISPSTMSKIDVSRDKIQTDAIEDTTAVVTEHMTLDDQHQSNIYEQFQDIYMTEANYEPQSQKFTNQENNINVVSDMYTKIEDAANREEHLEGEYEIPKIVTIEFSNGTITSEIQGNEDILNSDFASHRHTEPTQIPMIQILTATEKSENVTPNFIDTVTEINDVLHNIANDNITGQLYFKYGTDFIPAGFIQQPSGQIDVVIDLLSICHSNEQERSLSLQTICYCAKKGLQ